MEGWFSLCVIAISTVLAIWFLKLSRGKRDAKNGQRPPGPWTLPIIGSLHHVASVLPPHRRMMELSRRYGPLMHLTLGEIPTVVVSSAEAASLVMKTHDLIFSDRPESATLEIFGCGGKGIVFAQYGDQWRQMRKVCTMELLSAKQVRRMDGVRPELVDTLLRSIAAAASAGATVNVSEKVMALSNEVVSRAVFGGTFPQQDEYLRNLDEAFVLIGGFCLEDLFPSSRLVRWLSSGTRGMKRSVGHVQRINTDIIEARKARPRGAAEEEDLLDVLLRLQGEDKFSFPMTTESIGAVLFDMFAGATQTTGAALEWAMSELIRHPEAMAKVQLEIREVLGKDRGVISNNDLAELHYFRMVTKEVLRLHPSGPLIPRRAREDCKLMGFHIPEGTNLYINVLAVSRDPTCWKDPEEFRPERFENSSIDYNGTYYEFTPFGGGRRKCPGILFGALTMEIVLANLLYHFDWVIPGGASPKSLDMSEKYGIVVGRKCDLQLKAIPHGTVFAT